jgi:hypothetical protein
MGCFLCEAQALISRPPIPYISAVRRITHPLLVLLAIVFLVEAWLWRHLEPLVEAVVAWFPLRPVKAWVAGFVRKLPPAATLVVFAVPAAVLFPLKFVGLWLLAHKYWFSAGMILVLAKLIGLGVTAFVFEVTRPKLLQMAWFRWVYGRVLIGLDWAHRLVDPIKQRIKRLFRLFRSEQSGRLLRLMWRIRRRMNRERRAAKRALSAGATRVVRPARMP